MSKGLPKSIIKKYGITKKAWQVFRGGKSKSRGNPRRSSPRPKTRAKPKRRRTYLARKKSSRSRKITIPLAPIIGIVAAPGISKAIPRFLAGDVEGGLNYLKEVVGIWPDGTFHMGTLMDNVTPMVAGLLIHKFVGGAPLNLNRMLASANVPFLRI